MATKKKKEEEKEPEDLGGATEPHEPGKEIPKGHNVWVDKYRWEKLQLIKDELGSWTRFTDVAIEQLIASGLLSKEIREKIHKINKEAGIEELDDKSWCDTFKIREPWAETATNINKIREELAKNRELLADLAQAVEDHAMAMLEAELVKPAEE